MTEDEFKQLQKAICGIIGYNSTYKTFEWMNVRRLKDLEIIYIENTNQKIEIPIETEELCLIVSVVKNYNRNVRLSYPEEYLEGVRLVIY